MSLTSVTMVCAGLNVTVQTRPPNMGSGNRLHGDFAWMSIGEFTDNFPAEFRQNYHSATPKQAVCINREPILPDEVCFAPSSRDAQLPDITQHLILTHLDCY